MITYNQYLTEKGGMHNRKLAKAYNMIIDDEGGAEISMYGDVVMETPRDWWTGEKIDGLYIAAEDFLADLEELKDKENITVHINSGGGDLYAGLAIYNRLKALKGTVTTINDGLAASAASLIFQAGDVRKMNSGSNLMAHGVSGLLWGFYNVEDLQGIIKDFKAHNKAIINVYAEAMGTTYEEASQFVKGQNWMTGSEAVEKGLADEVITESIEPKNGLVEKIMNKIYSVYGNPENMAITEAVPPVAIKNNLKEGGNEEMDIKDVTALRAAFPELVAQIESEAMANARKEGTDAERKRIKAIDEIENAIADKNLLTEAKYGDNPMTAEEIAMRALQMQAQTGASVLNALNVDANASGANGVGTLPAEPENKPAEDPVAEAKRIAGIAKNMRRK